MLRQELYAEDGAPESVHPYAVAARGYAVRVLQRPRGGRPGVVFAHPSESVELAYERRPADPRTRHELVLDVDEFGNVTNMDLGTVMKRLLEIRRTV